MKVTRAVGSVTKDRDNTMNMLFDIGKKEAQGVKFTCILAVPVWSYNILSIAPEGDGEDSLMCFSCELGH